MEQNKTVLFTLLAFTLNYSYAQIQPIVGISAGLKKKSPAQSQTLRFMVNEFGDYETNAYVPNKKTVNKFTGNIHGGILFDIPQKKSR